MSTDIPSRVCFPYYLTRDVKLDVKLKVCRAEGLVARALTVSAIITSSMRALHQTPKDTSLPVVVFPFVCWDEWLVFPARYCDLALDAEIEFTFRDRGFRPVFHATLPLFDPKRHVLKVGAQRVRLHTHRHGHRHHRHRQNGVSDSGSAAEGAHAQALSSSPPSASSTTTRDGGAAAPGGFGRRGSDNTWSGEGAAAGGPVRGEYDDANTAFRIAKAAETHARDMADQFKVKWLDRMLQERVEVRRRCRQGNCS
jgi:hypothetical protein